MAGPVLSLLQRGWGSLVLTAVCSPAATVSAVTVPTAPLFSKKLSSSSLATSMDAGTPEPLPGRAEGREWEQPRPSAGGSA